MGIVPPHIKQYEATMNKIDQKYTEAKAKQMTPVINPPSQKDILIARIKALKKQKKAYVDNQHFQNICDKAIQQVQDQLQEILLKTY